MHVEIRSLQFQKGFLQDAHNLIRSVLARTKSLEGPVFHIQSDNGIKTVLTPEYANEIRAHDASRFGRAFTLEFHSDIHGFEPFNQLASSDEIF
ncbi:uncharacterized protein Aud_007536 [Aspergillus udagawae]|uniref:Uncharacterized protein n=1 Tax=Aspergillus udagawae TaxID=91492 RepID=A0A8E0QVA1_9EURO|nr:uncharacterized protein Aud_007536 [Aspergillus udagawae]GIC91095.1 hypothetical protein Aud_007536 [Aspergillus udagawae]